jgi:hypothetical protein
MTYVRDNSVAYEKSSSDEGETEVASLSFVVQVTQGDHIEKVCKWGIKFARRYSVLLFLEKVWELKNIHRVSETKLLADLRELFT